MFLTIRQFSYFLFFYFFFVGGSLLEMGGTDFRIMKLIRLTLEAKFRDDSLTYVFIY